MKFVDPVILGHLCIFLVRIYLGVNHFARTNLPLEAISDLMNDTLCERWQADRLWWCAHACLDTVSGCVYSCPNVYQKLCLWLILRSRYLTVTLLSKTSSQSEGETRIWGPREKRVKKGCVGMMPSLFWRLYFFISYAQEHAHGKLVYFSCHHLSADLRN